MMMKITKADIVGLINQRINSMATDEDGWGEPERSIVIAELRMLIKKIEKFGVPKRHYEK